MAKANKEFTMEIKEDLVVGLVAQEFLGRPPSVAQPRCVSVRKVRLLQDEVVVSLEDRHCYESKGGWDGRMWETVPGREAPAHGGLATTVKQSA